MTFDLNQYANLFVETLSFLFHFMYDWHAKVSCVMRRCVMPNYSEYAECAPKSLCSYLPHDLSLDKIKFCEV
jgi:hypothetical protein